MITHEFGNNSSEPIIDDEELKLQYTLEAQHPEYFGYMTFNSGTQLFSNIIPGLNTLEIFDFDNQTGNFENVRQIETDSKIIFMESLFQAMVLRFIHHQRVN